MALQNRLETLVAVFGGSGFLGQRPRDGAADEAQVAELVDALVSGTSAARRGGSSPLLGTRFAASPVREPS